ncbi:lipocalin family protein [Enhygromyxa salina]|uniref:Outer membrane lipoprotein Blc n=1 Tax=Enhygromyxa salina TaxID=215803 RepID=A0A2S9YNJ6_9BACT|nr:lipocalin family protein [Enhygromyxa salina]PRQ06654.1 Outer membrane lipoprotein Blc precursor [Enhygromyxa salina]
MKRLIPLLVALFSTACAGSLKGQHERAPLDTVDHVDLERYTGTWYEISHYPQRFQRNCTGTTATYELRPDGQINVINRCRKRSLDGRLATAKGRARVVDPATNAKLEVSFFRPFWGDYWIIDLGPDYEYAVVGHPTREYLWILSREPSMSPELYDAILERLRDQGYDTDRLVKTLQAKTE